MNNNHKYLSEETIDGILAKEYFEKLMETKAQIKDIENSLIEMLISDKTHKDRDHDLKKLIVEIRTIRRNAGNINDIIPF